MERGRRAVEPPPESKKAPGSTRREFLAALGIAALGGAAAKLTGAAEKAVDWYESKEQKELLEKIEKAKKILKENIKKGIVDADWVDKGIEDYNKTLKQLSSLDRNSPEFRTIDKQNDQIGYRLDDLRLRRGGQRASLLSEANKYAREFSTNDQAVTALAAAQVLFREKASGPLDMAVDLPYWHNLALAYKQLEGLTIEDVKAKITALCDKYKDTNWSKVPFEKIIYYLIDRTFDLELGPEKMKRQLDKLRPGWDTFPATHVNKKANSHYNDLSTLDIFELNRLQTVVLQLNNPQFRRAVFAGRDGDLHNTSTEFGGAIPLESQGHEPLLIPGERNASNDSYVPPPEVKLRALAGAAEFHYHATIESEPSDTHGPSSADFAYFTPGVVFSSVNKDTILTHFYVGRGTHPFGGTFEHKSDVISLGEIKR